MHRPPKPELGTHSPRAMSLVFIGINGGVGLRADNSAGGGMKDTGSELPVARESGGVLKHTLHELQVARGAR
jgi:hypothetical protein